MRAYCVLMNTRGLEQMAKLSMMKSSIAAPNSRFTWSFVTVPEKCIKFEKLQTMVSNAKKIGVERMNAERVNRSLATIGRDNSCAHAIRAPPHTKFVVSAVESLHSISADARTMNATGNHSSHASSPCAFVALSRFAVTASRRRTTGIVITAQDSSKDVPSVCRGFDHSASGSTQLVEDKTITAAAPWQAAAIKHAAIQALRSRLDTEGMRLNGEAQNCIESVNRDAFARGGEGPGLEAGGV